MYDVPSILLIPIEPLSHSAHPIHALYNSRIAKERRKVD